MLREEMTSGGDLAYLANLTGKDRVFEEQSSKLAASETRMKGREYGMTQLNAEVASRSETTACSKAKPTSRPRARSIVQDEEAIFRDHVRRVQDSRPVL